MIRTPTLSGLDDFGLSRVKLRNLGTRLVTVEVSLRLPPYIYPSQAEFGRLVRKPPEERRELVREWRRKEHRRLCQEMPVEDYETIHFNSDPFGLRVTLAAKWVHRLLRLRHAESVEITSIKGFKRKKVKTDLPRLYAVKARFAVQMEGQRNGLQLYEDRIFLLTASSEQQAKNHAYREFVREQFPYLTTSGHFSRWRFEGVINVCELVDSEFSPRGTEVYYEFRKRRVKPEYEWHPARTV